MLTVLFQYLIGSDWHAQIRKIFGVQPILGTIITISPHLAVNQNPIDVRITIVRCRTDSMYFPMYITTINLKANAEYESKWIVI